MAERDIIFLVGKEEYGLDVTFVTAIEPMMDIVPVPNAPACVLGLMNLRGEVIPVYSLRKRFGMEEQSDVTKNKLIVARYDGKSIAFKVDEVMEMQDFEDSAISDTPIIAKSARTAYVRAVANKQGKLVLLLNPAGMYEGDEEAQMEEVLKNLEKSE
ncbi:MAG: purine-binding chemotaxis protein CheW [Lachnospiraceae bacterium]|nr:purine-binding chemotaxis protein CheW [Lachnospiraceae bacterium]